MDGGWEREGEEEGEREREREREREMYIVASTSPAEFPW